MRGVEPLEQIARDVRVIRRVIELLVALALIAGCWLLWDSTRSDSVERPNRDEADQLCIQFPQLC